MTCRLKLVLKIRNTGISELPLNFFSLYRFHFTIFFWDLEYVKETESPYHIRLKSVFTSFHCGNFCSVLRTGSFYVWVLKNPFPHFLNYFRGTMFSRYKCLNETGSLTSHVTKPFFRYVNKNRYIKKLACVLFDFY